MVYLKTSVELYHKNILQMAQRKMERDSEAVDSDDSLMSSPPRTDSEPEDGPTWEQVREAELRGSLLAARAISMLGPSKTVFTIFGRRLGGLFSLRDIENINVKPNLKIMLRSRVFWGSAYDYELEMVYKLLHCATDEIDAAIAQQQQIRFEVTGGDAAPSVRWSSVTQSAKSRLTYRCTAYKKVSETHTVCLRTRIINLTLNSRLKIRTVLHRHCLDVGEHILSRNVALLC